MKFDPYQPYNDLPLLFPGEKYWRTIKILEQTNKANKALAELKGRMAAIPNPKIFINTLALQEAKDSSSIENVFTTNDKLFKALTATATPDPQTKEVLRYGKALTDAFNKIKTGDRFSIDMIEKIYQNIKNKDDGIRDNDVFIGNHFKTVYTPPCCKEILIEKLNNWLTYANGGIEVDPLIKMAILHYQFEAIHPFSDGNGRTGRVLNVLYLTMQNLLDEPILYHSKYINTYKKEYYRLLIGVTEDQKWEEWILYMLKAIEHTANSTLQKVVNIINLFEQVKQKIKGKLPNIYSFELVEILFTQIYTKYAILEKNKIASRNTASKYLNQLVDIGILEKEKVGTEYIYKNIELFELFKEL